MRDWKVEVKNALGKTLYLILEARSAKDAQKEAEEDGYQVVSVNYMP